MQNGGVVTGSLQNVNSDHKVPYTVLPFSYQCLTREIYYAISLYRSEQSRAGMCGAGGLPLCERDEHPDRMEELVRAVEIVGCDRLVRTL